MRFTKAQQDAIVAVRPQVCVSAGAGSGKTAILIERIAHLLDTPDLWPDGAPQLERIVAITFTEKAAAEMKARLRINFRNRPALDDPEAMRFWREMERQVDSARITTIHAFCASLLREHSLRIGMDPDWSVLDDAESAALAERVIVETLHRLLEAEDPAALRLSLDTTRAELKQALFDLLGMRWKFQDRTQAARHEAPEALLVHWQQLLPEIHDRYLRGLAFSPEPGDLLDALRCVDGECTNPADKREQQRQAYIAVLEGLLAGDKEAVSRIEEVLELFKRMGTSKKGWTETGFSAAGEAIKNARDFFKKKCLMPEWDAEFEARAAQMTCDFHAVGDAVMSAFSDARKERAAIDYEDMINETLRLLRENIPLRERVGRGIRFLLIDEFQDTDARQLEAARLLAEVKGGPDLFIVGDAKQSIYNFRGADVALFNAELQRDGKRISLEDNFRSLPDVLYFVNDFFSRSKLLHAVEEYRPMGAFRVPMELPRVELFVPDSADVEDRDKAPEMRARDALFTARRIREMCMGADPLLIRDDDVSAPRPATYDDIALLFRRGSYMHDYEAALRAENVPYVRVAGAGFFQRREIQDVLALLKFIRDPWDEEALLTLLRSPLAGLSDESLLRMTLHAGNLAAAFHSADLPDAFDQAEALTTVRALFADLYACREQPPGLLMRRLLERTGFEAVLLSGYLGLQKASNLRKMVQMADAFAHARPATLAEFTHYLADVSMRELREGEAPLQAKGLGAVTLMSIHKSKGLEFPVVFLPELYVGARNKATEMFVHHPDIGLAVKAPDADGNLQSDAVSQMIMRCRRQGDDAEMARILYVAMTRARDYLVLCGHAEPARQSWAEALNRSYALPECAQNAVIEGEGWKALVKRVVPEAVPGPTETLAASPPDLSALANKVAPVVACPGGPRIISVSRLLALMDGAAVNGEAEEEEEHRRAARTTEEAPGAAPLDAVRQAAVARGLLVHRLFELWDFKADMPPDIEGLIREARLGLTHRDGMKEQLLRIVERLRASEQWPLFTQANTTLREVPFLLDVGPVLVRGVIDAVLDYKIIVDYKTGQPDAPWGRRYETQLRLYAAAILKLTGHLPETGMLWYADHGVMHEVEISEARINQCLDEVRSLPAMKP